MSIERDKIFKKRLKTQKAKKPSKSFEFKMSQNRSFNNKEKKHFGFCVKLAKQEILHKQKGNKKQ